MSVVYKARVWEIGTVTGSGVHNLPNVANSGAWRTVAGSGLASGAQSVFCIQDTVTNAWELSLFTYTAGSPGTLTRVQLLESSTGSAISFAGNSCNITLEIPSPQVVSSGSPSAGLPVALGASGLIDSSALPAATAGTIWNGSRSVVNVSSAPTTDTPVDSCFLTITAGATSQNYLVSFCISHDGNHGNSFTLYLDGTRVSSQYFDSLALNSTSNRNCVSVAGVLVTLPGDSASHTIQVEYQAAVSTSGFNFDDRFVSAVAVGAAV